jgi:hypothetical protein
MRPLIVCISKISSYSNLFSRYMMASVKPTLPWGGIEAFGGFDIAKGHQVQKCEILVWVSPGFKSQWLHALVAPIQVFLLLSSATPQ